MFIADFNDVGDICVITVFLENINSIKLYKDAFFV